MKILKQGDRITTEQKKEIVREVSFEIMSEFKVLIEHENLDFVEELIGASPRGSTTSFISAYWL